MGDFVVIQIKSERTGGEWLDYARTDAGTARMHMAAMTRDNREYRAKHWITGDLLTPGQLGTMAEHLEWFEEQPPPAE